ncbi:MAG: hypothetical protein PHN60_01350 [Candidatus Gracilibacteria bacterium]|nr:hypothetical protein [Candidatus Gracilibacteria bacterium]
MPNHLHEPTDVLTHEQDVQKNLSDSNFVQITTDQALRYLNQIGITSLDIQDILDKKINEKQETVRNRVNILLADAIELPAEQTIQRNLADHNFVQKIISQASGYLKDIGITSNDIQNVLERNTKKDTSKNVCSVV